MERNCRFDMILVRCIGEKYEDLNIKWNNFSYLAIKKLMIDLKNKISWAQQTGLLPIHLNPKEETERFIMLDGGYYDFCLDLSGEEIQKDICFSKSWSTNTKNYIVVNNTLNQVGVYNWFTETLSSLQCSVVSDKFAQFIQILNHSSYRSDEDIVPFVLRLFRQMRSLTGEKDDPVIALNLLYKLLISLDEDINQINCTRWQIEDVQMPDNFEYFVDSIKSGVRGIRPNLDLILRHCSGPLFQEAHREVVSFNQERDLFGGVSSEMKFALTNYSSIHYTPQYLARSIVENVIGRLDLRKEQIKILDPACGSGAFLMESLKILRDKDYKGHILIEGWDSSPCAVSTTRFLLNYEQNTQWGKNNFNFNIRLVKDSLLEKWDNNYDVILMNPPFLSWELVRNEDSREAIISILKDITTRKRPNQAAAFFYQAIKSLAPKGVLGVVLPSSILLSDQYSQLRESVLNSNKLEVVGRLGNFIFEDALADVSFLIAEHNIEYNNPEIIWCRNRKGVAYDAIKHWRKMKYNNIPSLSTEDYSIYRTLQFPIIKDSWNVVPRRDELFLSYLVSWQNMGRLKAIKEIFNIYQGLLTGKRDVFEISLSDYSALPDEEKKYYRPLVKSGTIDNGSIKIKEYIWFPYDKNGLMINNEEELLSLTISWQRLESHKNDLEKRKSVKHWWELTRPRLWQFTPKFRLYSQRFGNSSSFGIGREDNYVIEEGNAFEFKHPEKYEKSDYYFYLSLFSSNIFERLLSIYSKRIMAGYDLGQSQIKDIPIIDVKDGNCRKCEVYKKLVDIGIMLSQGELYMKEAIDECLQIFYPNYEE